MLFRSIEKFTAFGEKTECNQQDAGSYTRFELSNPGKIDFTGKKTIQGETENARQTYIGYIDYEYNTTDLFGNELKQTEKKIFKYGFPIFNYGSSDTDTVEIQITIDTRDYDLKIEQNSKGKIIKFRYQTIGNQCRSEFEEHYVKQ